MNYLFLKDESPFNFQPHPVVHRMMKVMMSRIETVRKVQIRCIEEFSHKIFFFVFNIKFYKMRLLETLRTSYFTKLRGRYHGVQDTMTTPQSLT